MTKGDLVRGLWLAVVLIAASCVTPPVPVAGRAAQGVRKPTSARVLLEPGHAPRGGVVHVLARRPMLLSRLEISLTVTAGMETSAITAALAAQAPLEWTERSPPSIVARGDALLFEGVTDVAFDPGDTGLLVAISMR